MGSGLRVAVLACLVAAACGGSSSPPSPTPPSSTYAIPAADLADMTAEKMMGNTAASVTIVEYSSLTCPHCVTFHLGTLPALKAAYIDAGKVKYVYRDYPLAGASTQAAAYAAASLARCAGSARYFEALDLLYKSQASWTAVADVPAALKQAVSSMGMPTEKMDACLVSTVIQGEVARQMNEGRTAYGVTGTPTVLVNGQKTTGATGGAPSFEELDGILKTLVK